MEVEKELNIERIESLLARTGMRGAKLLTILGKQSQFMRAIESEVGQQLLRDALSISESLLDKIVHEEATEGERAEYRALKKILLTWAARINGYHENLSKIK